MACTMSHEAYEQLLGEAADVSGTVREILKGLLAVTPMNVGRIATRWDINEFQLVIPVTLLLFMWGPIATELSAYHRVSLPTWLTFGYPIGFGGALPLICCDIDKVLRGGEGNYPCLPYEVKAWLAKVVGPSGWEHLFHPGEKIWICIIVATLTPLFLAIIVRAIRKAGRRRAEKRRLEALSEGLDDTECEIEKGLLGKAGLLSDGTNHKEKQ